MVFFSAPGRLGRISLPANRWTRMKPAPTGTNRSRYATRGVMRHPVGWGDPGTSAPARVGGQLLAAGEAGVQLVPVGDLRLAQPPAQEDLAAVEQAAEVDQAGHLVLQLHAQRLQLG